MNEEQKPQRCPKEELEELIHMTMQKDGLTIQDLTEIYMNLCTKMFKYGKF